MFGYVFVNQQEMKFREFDVYRSWYCGLCRTLKRRGGFLAQLTLSYDMTFLILLLHGLYEPQENRGQCRCLAHPTRRHDTRVDEFTEYAADMNVILTYHNCMDDWNDQKKMSRLLYAQLLKRQYRRAKARWPQKAEAVEGALFQLAEVERKGSAQLDAAAGCFGRLMGQIVACKSDLWETELFELGFYLGKFIYLSDAYEDLEKDRKTKSYNPFLQREEEADFEEQVHAALQMMMSECAGRFERLPILKNAEILRNILYSGVWCRYEAARQKRKETKENHGQRSL